MVRNGQSQVTGWVGWVYFAGLLMVIVGIFQAIAGLTALLKDDFYTISNGDLVVFNLTAWGWIHLVLGIIVLVAGNAVMSGHLWGRMVAIFLAILSIVAHFLFLDIYPVWSIIVMILGVFIIYALTVHGDEVRDQ